MDEEYFLWQSGIYRGYLYSISHYNGSHICTFYTDFKSGRSAGEAQLSATVEFQPNTRISDDQISEAFVKSLSEKIYFDVRHGSKEYVERMKTLPRGFFTTVNVDSVLDNVNHKTIHSDKSTRINSDIACCDFVEYAHTQNKSIIVGTGRKFIGGK